MGRQFKPGQLQTGSLYNISASYAVTASYAANGGGTSINTGSFVTTSSFNAFTASYTTGSFTGSFTGNLIGSSSFASTASYIQLAQSASYALYAVSASYEINYETSSSYAETASIAVSSSFATSASYATNALNASYAANGGVTQLLAGPNVILSPTNGLGQVTVSATLSGSTIFNTATGSYGSFYDTTTQTNPVANIPRSMSFNSTDITNGVSISGSTSPFDTYIKTQNAGVYNIQFSAQLDKTDSGVDEVVIWLRKNGTDLTDSATTITLSGNNDKQVAAWNWFVQSAADDYYQIIWSSADTNLRLLAEPISGTHPGIPSVILTANRIDQFLSNTGSFSGSFTGIFTGSLSGTSSYATQALSASYAPDTTFPYTGSARITGSLGVTGSVSSRVDSPSTSLWQTHFTGERFDGSSLQGRVYIKTNYPFVEDFYIGKNNGSANNDTSTNGGIHYSNQGQFTVRNTQTSGFYGVTLNADQNLEQRVGIDTGRNSFGLGWSLRNFTNSIDYVNFAHNSNRVGIGWNDKTTSLLGATLDVKATGSLSSDIALRVRNSGNTYNILSVNGDSSVQIGSDTLASGKLTIAAPSTATLNLDTGYSVDTATISISRRISPTYNTNTFLFTHNSFNDGNVQPYKFHFVNPSTYWGYTEAGFSMIREAGFMFFKDSATAANLQMKLTPDNVLTMYTGSLGAVAVPTEVPVTGSAFQLFASSSNNTVVPVFIPRDGKRIQLYAQAAVTSSQGIADALTNLGFLTGSSTIPGVSFGPFGIANTSGSYTYYTTFSSSMAAATSGQTVEMFADVTETTNISIALKNGVNINGNGHTYTLNQAGTANCIQDGGVTVNCSISNITFKRLGGTASSTDTLCMYITGASIIKAYSTILIGGATNMRCLTVNNGSAEVYGIYAEGYNPITVTNGTLNDSTGKSLNGGGISVGANGKIVKCIGYGVNVGGISNAGLAIDSYGYDSGVQGFGNSGTAINCTGWSGGSGGFATQPGSTCINCTGYSTAQIGFFSNGAVNITSCKGYSVAGAGLAMVNGAAYDSVGFSTTSYGIWVTNSGATATDLRSCKATSLAAMALFMNNTTSGCKIYNTEAYSKWNNAAGHGVVVAGSNAEIVQCTIEVTNASANCISGSSALTAKYANNAFKGSAVAVNANITQGIVNTHDNFGNIII